MVANLVNYLIPGLLWATFAVRTQQKLYGDSTKLWQYVLVFIIDLLLWPIAVVLATWHHPCDIKPDEPSVKTWRKLD